MTAHNNGAEKLPERAKPREGEKPVHSRPEEHVWREIGENDFYKKIIYGCPCGVRGVKRYRTNYDTGDRMVDGGPVIVDNKL